jgi:hypothetical protein
VGTSPFLLEFWPGSGILTTSVSAASAVNSAIGLYLIVVEGTYHNMKIFVSHIAEESALAQVMKTWIEDAFLGQCSVFVSSDSASLPAGTRWLDKLDQELNDAKIMLVLCSPGALQRPWINFETGCAWTRQIPVIPVCHSGQTRGALPTPISSFQALQLDSADFEAALLAAIANHLGFPRHPRIDVAAMRADLQEALRNAKPAVVKGARVGATEVPDEYTNILLIMANGGKPFATDYVAQTFSLPVGRAQYIIDFLEENKLVSSSLVRGRPPVYSVSKAGRQFLVERGLL